MPPNVESNAGKANISSVKLSCTEPARSPTLAENSVSAAIISVRLVIAASIASISPSCQPALAASVSSTMRRP